MEEFVAKIAKAIEYLEGIDYSKAFKNGIIVLSFSILQFFGYIYFAFGSVPPFVDFKSFSSLIFIAGGFLAISSLLSRVLSMFFVRFLFPYSALVFASRRRLKHISRRVERRKNNGFLVPEEAEVKKRYFSQNLERTRALYNKALEAPELRYDLMLRYILLTLIFSLLYLGWNVALVCIVAVLVYCLILFFAYSIVFILLEAAAQVAIRKLNSDEDPSRGWLFKEFFRGFVVSVRSVLKFRKSYLKAESQFFKLFISANVGLIIVISALVFGTGRSAHILSTETYDIAFDIDQVTEVHPTSVVLVTSNGVLGVSESEQSMLFISFDAAPVVTPNNTIQPRSYVTSLIQTLFPIGRD